MPSCLSIILLFPVVHDSLKTKNTLKEDEENVWGLGEQCKMNFNPDPAK